MITTLITVGIACLLAAIIGGGFKGLGVEIPVLRSRNRQIVLAMAGAVLLGSAAGEHYRQQRMLIDPDNELTIALESYDQGDFTDALQHFAASARRGKHESEYHYGEMLYHGEGCVPDRKETIRWIRRAAESGYAPAEASLGAAFAAGDGVEKDVAQAKLWADRSAAQGDPWGLEVVAMLETDTGKKLSALYKAAALGYAPAQAQITPIILGQMIAGGQTFQTSSPTEFLISADWIKKAAQQGEPNAQVGIALILSSFLARKGQGPYTAADLEYLGTAYMWVVLALEHDHRFPLTDKERSRALELRKKIEQALPVEDQLRVAALTKSWKPILDLPYRHGHE